MTVDTFDMPTGYTADVQSGKVTTFPEFAMQCARAFGALISMRDDAPDARVPDMIEPNTSYYDERLAQATADLERLRAMTPQQAQEEAERVYESAYAEWVKYEARKAEERARYEAMLEQVKAWEPPTFNHIEMKKFMIQQLEESIRFDCGTSEPPQPRNAQDWHQEAVASARRSLLYLTEQRAEEIDRAASRTAWIQALRKSLVQEEATP